MITKMYSLYDSKALIYSPPFTAVSHGLAMRMVMEVASDLQTSVGRHPADFTLYCIGAFNDQSGEMLPATREHVSDVLSLTPRAVAGPGLFDDASRSAPNGEVK